MALENKQETVNQTAESVVNEEAIVMFSANHGRPVRFLQRGRHHDRAAGGPAQRVRPRRPPPEGHNDHRAPPARPGLPRLRSAEARPRRKCAPALRGNGSRGLCAVALPQRRHREGQPRLGSLEPLGPRLLPARGGARAFNFGRVRIRGGAKKVI